MKHAGLLLMLAGSAAIGTASILGRTGSAEPALWLALSFAGAIVFVKTREHPVRYAFPATAAAGLVAPVLQAVFFAQLLAHNPAAGQQLRNVPGGLSPQGFMLAMAPVVAIAYGGVTSLVTLAVARLLRKAAAPA